MPQRDYQFTAILKTLNHIEVHIPKSYNGAGFTNFYLYEDGIYVKELHIASVNENSKFYTYNLDEIPDLKMGVDYDIYDEINIVIQLNCSYLNRLDKYIDRTYYEGELGAIYSKEKTTFRVFSPLASYCTVFVYTKESEEVMKTSKNMVKDVKTGVFECEIEGEELLARAICHELDHLDGHLYVEKVEGGLHDVKYEEEVEIEE